MATQQSQTQLLEVCKHREEIRKVSTETAAVDARDDGKTLILDATTNAVVLTLGYANDCVGVKLWAILVAAENSVSIARSGTDRVFVSPAGAVGPPIQVTSTPHILAAAPPQGVRLRILCTGTEWYVSVPQITQPFAVPGPAGWFTAQTVTKANHGGVYSIDLTAVSSFSLVPASEAPGTTLEITVFVEGSSGLTIACSPNSMLMNYAVRSPATAELIVFSPETLGGTQEFGSVGVGSKFSLKSTGSVWILDVLIRF